MRSDVLEGKQESERRGDTNEGTVSGHSGGVPYSLMFSLLYCVIGNADISDQYSSFPLAR